MSKLELQLKQLEAMSNMLESDVTKIQQVIARGAPAASTPMNAERAIEDALRLQAGRFNASLAAGADDPQPMVRPRDSTARKDAQYESAGQEAFVDVPYRDIA